MSKTEDAAVFGEDALIYCDQHLTVHQTGWCTVPVRNKVALSSKTMLEAYAECERKQLRLYNYSAPVWHPVVKQRLQKEKANG